ncbi:thiamine-phosphate kinase [bacterium]|nr:thiamine-phosphate kinase [bacterium]
MREHLFLNKIIKTLKNSEYLGDDCAYLKDLGIVVTQDTLVEDVHFSLDYTDAYKLGYKSAAVNISDIYASGAVPKYLSISLSLPKKCSESFVEEFYKAVDSFGLDVIGGDITGSDKITVSVCAIGIVKNRKISSRKNADIGDLVVVTGEHGTSACGLFLLQNGLKDDDIINEHLMPKIDGAFSAEIAQKCTKDYAMMDTSDGLADALFKIAQSSNKTIKIDFEKIPYNKKIEQYANFKDYILYGGEDYKLVATVDKETLNNISPELYYVIGAVEEKQNCPLKINFGNKISDIKNLDKTFNHFEDK